MPEDRVEVRDLANPKRVLGTLPRIRETPGRIFRMVVKTPTTREWVDDVEIFHDSFVTDSFHLEACPETHRAVYLTDTPLEYLLLLETFRLPGEDGTAARHRRYWAVEP